MKGIDRNMEAEIKDRQEYLDAYDRKSCQRGKRTRGYKTPIRDSETMDNVGKFK